MPKVTEAHLEARRQQVLDAAWACFARKGYHQTTMQDICEESGLSPGAIYRYFDSKEAILAAIGDRSQEMGRALVEEARSRMGGPLDTLEVIGQTMLSVFYDPMFETTTRVNIEIWPELIRNEALRDNLFKESKFWLAVVTELLSEAKEQGQLRPGIEPASLAAILISVWDGLRRGRLVDPDSFNPERLIELMQVMVPEERSFDAEKLRRELATREAPKRPPFGTPGRRGRTVRTPADGEARPGWKRRRR